MEIPRGAIGRHPRRLRRLRNEVMASTVSVLLFGAMLAVPAQAQSPGASPAAAPIPTTRPAIDACEPAKVPFDAENLALTGLWSADDRGIYYIRQDKDRVWWNGMSDRLQRNGEAGREWDNVAFGRLKNGRLTMDWADVPFSGSLGRGTLLLKPEADKDGNLRILGVSHEGFGGSLWTPCAPEPMTFTDFARPFSVQPQFGQVLTDDEVGPELAVVEAGPGLDSGMSAWVIGPGWTSTCSAPPDSPAPVGVDGFLAYLETIPAIEVSEPTPMEIDGHEATSVDITAAPGGRGCDGWVQLWTVSDLGAGMDIPGSARLIALEVDGATVVFEIWGNNPDQWRPQAQALLDTLEFEGHSNIDDTIGEAADDGARIVQVDVIDGRTRDLLIESPSVGYATVRLLLPEGFDEQAAADLPVLYLLHGQWDDYTSWTRETDVKELTAPTNLLVAMPHAGANGWYADWYQHGNGGIPKWETFHTQELPQLLERNYGAGDKRVIAGLSMGGYGALSYAARHPGMYAAAASFSGVPDILAPDFDTWIDPVFGDKVEQADNWAAHDVVTQAAGLEGTPLYIAYGNGRPGPFEGGTTGVDNGEKWIKARNDKLVARLEELGIPATVNAYGPGTHSWPYWERELHNALPMLLAAVGE
jgi:diacylglycerol O-acyltransferase/trehalose O-mycolyltransferase